MNSVIDAGTEIFKKLTNMDVYDRYDYLSKNEEKFLKLYPVVAKYMCLSEYSPTAFMIVLRKQQESNLRLANKLDTPESEYVTIFFENQALYAKLLFEERRESKKKCDKIYKEVLNELWMTRKESERAIETYSDTKSKVLKSELVSFLAEHLSIHS